MEERKKVKVKYYTDVKHYTIIEVYEDEVEAVRRANRITWKEDHSQRQKREYLNKKGIAICSLEDIDSDGSWIEDGRQNAEQKLVEAETRKEEHEKLHKAIKQLNEKQQKLIQLVFFEGKTQREVAIIFGVQEAAISKYLARTYAILKKIMENS